MSRSIEVAATDPVSVLRIRGGYGPGDFTLLTATLAAAMAGAATRVVVCEISELEVTEASLLTAFPTAIRLCGGWPGVSLHLARPPESLRAALTAARLHRYLSIHHTLSEAIIASHPEEVTDVRSLALDPRPEHLKLVRALAAAMWPGLDPMPLMANELAANVIQHVRQPFLFSLVKTPTRALVATTDPSPRRPALRTSADGPRGFGMHLIHTMSDDWGVRWVHPRGKTVWAAMAV